MLYVPNIQNVNAHRTFTPLYEKYEATPVTTFLDPSQATGQIFSGMAMYKTGGDTVALLDGASTTARFCGFSALDANSNIDDYSNTLNNSWSVWLGSNNAQFQVEAPAFDVTATWTVPSNGSRQYIYPIVNSGLTGSQMLGQLTTVQNTTSNYAAAIPIAYLVDVLGPTTIVIGLLPFAAPVEVSYI